ncbi:hypothetical protein NM688_g5607 [Phlebia brevispora]|uniref:Uncharacterized protein n=1 Tax=Phlebia brevispora TaxID=194682 RepID=A0ACC1SSP1_9APHY|nr:hypothetical protein NM688_g5607 [Phlebia brevispora]
MPATDVESLSGRSIRNTSASPLPSVSLSREHITDAFQESKDGGATLDLTRKNLTDVGEDGAAELANVGQEVEMGGDGTVERITLAHNRLTTLPMAFSLLSRLRYLVLKHNNFTVFPDVLTIMPSLEILDISYNKVKRLPSQPGSLTKLQVFSIAHNKIHQLPPYFIQFRSLQLFKAEHNPLDWPPKDVMSSSARDDDRDDVKEWIRGIQTWMETNPQHAGERKQSDDSIRTDASSTKNDREPTWDRTRYGDTKSPLDEGLFVQGSSTHDRSSSVESEASVYSDEDVKRSRALSTSQESKSPRPPRLRLESLPSIRGIGASPVRSPDSYLPTPAESISSNEDSSTLSSTRQQHGRNASYAPGMRPSPHNRLASKKSLPDLRPAELNLRNGQAVAGPSKISPYPFSMPSPPHRQESDSSNNSSRPGILSQNGVMTSPTALERPAPPMDGERNSYFRRLSTLTPATLAKAIPTALLTLIDAVRGIFFALSQIYQTLWHYTVYAIDERLSAVLLKVLDPASAYLSQLINSMDRFDALSRRNVPPPAVCRAVVESCRDNVTVFGKAVGVLALQLKVLATHDDVRHTRQMLITLYGAMGEISGAWQDIAGRIEEVKPLLRDHRPPPASKTYQHTPALRTNLSISADIAAVSPMTAPLSVSSPLLPPQSASRPIPRSASPHSAFDGRVRMNRRHAGSFSYKDVELGKLLPSNTDSPQLSAGLVGGSQTPVLRTPRRPNALTPSSSNGSINHDGTIRPSTSLPRWDTHSRQSSTSSFLASASYSPSLVLRAPTDIPSSTSTLVDKEALEAMQAAVQAAPPVWAMTDELLQDAPEMKEELSELLAKAKDITGKLRDSIRAVENGDAPADRKMLRDDAHVPWCN